MFPIAAAAIILTNLHDRLPADAADKNSARYAATVAIETNLAGRTLNIFTTLDHTRAKYVRSSTCWATGFDLSCVAVYNSYGMQFSTNGCCPWESASRRAGTLISPRHLIYAHHYTIPNGTQLRFISRSNTIVTRTLTDSMQISNTDLQVGVLDANVPRSWIDFAKVLPANFTHYFPASLDGIPALCFNQNQEALISDIASLYPSATNATRISFAMPADEARKPFYRDKVSGDSSQPAFLILNGQVVLLTVWTGGGGGIGGFIPGYVNEINAAMKKLGGGWRLTPVDLGRFTNYETVKCRP